MENKLTNVLRLVVKVFSNLSELSRETKGLINEVKNNSLYSDARSAAKGVTKPWVKNKSSNKL